MRYLPILGCSLNRVRRSACSGGGCARSQPQGRAGSHLALGPAGSQPSRAGARIVAVYLMLAAYGEPRPVAVLSLIGLLLGTLAVQAASRSVAASPGAEPDTTGSQLQETPPRAVSRAARRASDSAVWVKRRRQFTHRGLPYGFTGFPIALVTFDRELSWGGQLRLTEYSRQPFRYKAALRWMQPLDGSRSVALRLSAPAAASPHLGLYIQICTGGVSSRFHGFGNSSPRERVSGDVADHSEEYPPERYSVKRTRLTLQLSRVLVSPLIIGAGAIIEQNRLSAPDEWQRGPGTQSLLRDGSFRTVALVVRWDTRDDPGLTGRGALHEWSYERTAAGMSSLARGESLYGRVTITDLRYFPVRARLLVASRNLFEVLSGEVPVHAYGRMGSSRRRVVGLGGDSSLRGYGPQRFTDDVRYLLSVEGRYWLRSQWVRGQFLEWKAVGFVDAGRVWADMGSVRPTGLHLAAGAGVRLLWDRDFVVRAEIAVSAENALAILKLRGSF